MSKGSQTRSLEDILRVNPPSINYGEKNRRTNEAAWHRDKILLHNVVLWQGFQSDIATWLADAIDDAKTKNRDQDVPSSIICDCQLAGGLDSIFCGREITIQGRFMALIAKPVDDLIKYVCCESQSSDHSTIDDAVLRDLEVLDTPQSKPDSEELRVKAVNERAKLSEEEEEEEEVEFYNKLPARSIDTDLGNEMQRMNLLEEKSKSKPKPQRKTGSSKRVEPDVVTCINAGKTLLCVGEIKTPFKHELELLSKLWATKDERSESAVKAKEWLGQIGHYMRRLGVKIGYLTTYKHTVFVKLEKNSRNEWTLAVSPVVCSSGMAPSEAQEPRGVSEYGIRQCLFAIIHHLIISKEHCEKRAQDALFLRTDVRTEPEQ